MADVTLSRFTPRRAVIIDSRPPLAPSTVSTWLLLTGCALGPPPSHDWMMGPRPAALNFSRKPARPPVSLLVM